MWTGEQIDERPHTESLCHYNGRLYWLVDDEEADPTEDLLGRKVARKQLITYDVDTGERATLARSLPPSPSLAVGPKGAFLWGLKQESVLRVTPAGAVEQYTVTEEQPDGALRCVGERLFFEGKLNPATTGVAVYEPTDDRFRRILETGDPTPSTLDRVHVDEDCVWYLHHTPRGWKLDAVDLARDEQQQLVTDQDLMLRRFTKTDRGFLMCDDHAIYLYADGELSELTECDVPPEHLHGMGERALWTSSAVENEDSELVAGWQIHAVDLDGSEAEVLYETDHHIADLECGEWGLACLLREAKFGVVAEIGTGTVGSVVVVRP
ncbi:hypothetical protein FIV42_00050 [Persicimonas caeni]|uniref:Uncharacterized protein n=1 Tax=Persicimonas caeni TaxID=2292766 RepID=A0A4Y6PLH9_PERCE|nr:hypothetical protein [Persicimonas caeni]QDG49184.1 hypothetical protein FIV42_00050 [Persicimonas caeni]QED30405.1 hypothetical protein FRD00_00045 [Persicimonas caeni]